MIRHTEALFRFGAARPARDDFDENPYQEWTECDARRPGREVYGRSPFMRSLAPAELRLLAEEDVQARAEYAAEREAEANQASDSHTAGPSATFCNEFSRGLLSGSLLLHRLDELSPRQATHVHAPRNRLSAA